MAQRKVRERLPTGLRDAGGLSGLASPDISISTTHGAVTPALDRRTPDAVYFEQVAAARGGLKPGEDFT